MGSLPAEHGAANDGCFRRTVSALSEGPEYVWDEETVNLGNGGGLVEVGKEKASLP
jgi:hypothetical protein